MKDLKIILENKVDLYNQPTFIQGDPISIPHQFTLKEDIEISGFLTAIIAWGRRDQIIKSANYLMELIEHSPYDFVINAGPSELKKLTHFYYRTFQADDLLFLVEALKNIYINYGGLEQLAIDGFVQRHSIKDVIMNIRGRLMQTDHLKRSEKHLANPDSNSAAKRINMFLRWMARQDDKGVDFGIWKSIPASKLMCPLDVHSGRVARELGLLKRTQNDWKAVEELTANLRKFDPDDPVKYDFALFSIGVFE